MRNRVVLAVARLVRLSMVLALVPVALVTGAATASATTANDFAASNMQFPIGPVGVAAVAVGLGGLVTGLVRHRRREIAAQLARAKPESVVERTA